MDYNLAYIPESGSSTMSRENKFRVWDKNLSSMFSSDIILDSLDMNALLSGKLPEVNKRIILMQYTGLKDSKGAEIYEGDILNVYNWGFNSKKESLGIAKVIWSDDEKGWRYHNAVELMSEDVYDQFRNVEVIGNIYENSELLKGVAQ
jgi:uncharacterized phage protein (TIGR01671 family)